MNEDERDDYYLPYFVERLTVISGEMVLCRAVCKACWFPTTWHRDESALEYAYSQHNCKDSEEWD